MTTPGSNLLTAIHVIVMAGWSSQFLGKLPKGAQKFGQVLFHGRELGRDCRNGGDDGNDEFKRVHFMDRCVDR